MSKEKKIVSKQDIFKLIKFLLSVALIIGIGYVILNYVPFIARYENYAIATGSMEPVIDTGDLVIINTDFSYEELDEGDIIAFNADAGLNGTIDVVVHYIKIITEEEGVTTYYTNSEKSSDADPWKLHNEDILGIYVNKLSKVGNLLRFTQSTLGKIIIIIDLVVAYILIDFIFDDKDKKKKKKKLAEELKKEKIEEAI